MKKYFLSAIIIVLLSLLSATGYGQRFLGGVVAGINLSQLDGDQLAGYNKVGFSTGARVSTVLSERWRLNIELLFSQQGSSRSNNDDPFATYDKIKLNFVEVPVLINFIDWKLHFHTGLSYHRLINFTAEDQLGTNLSEQLIYNSNNLAVVVGATYFKNEHWGFDMRWSRALLDLEGNANNGRLIGKWITFRTVYVF